MEGVDMQGALPHLAVAAPPAITSLGALLLLFLSQEVFPMVVGRHHPGSVSRLTRVFKFPPCLRMVKAGQT